MSKQVPRRVRVVHAKPTKSKDEMALRKVARAVLAIAERQLQEERTKSLLKSQESGDAKE